MDYGLDLLTEPTIPALFQRFDKTMRREMSNVAQRISKWMKVTGHWQGGIVPSKRADNQRKYSLFVVRPEPSAMLAATLEALPGC